MVLALMTLVVGCGQTYDEERSDAFVAPPRTADGSKVDPPSAPPTDLTPVPVAEPTTVVRVLHQEHRAIPGVMFGGWGPHLGHLMRRKVNDKETLYFVDDACAPGACNVNVNQRVDYLRLGEAGWEKIDSIPLPATIQQNTASIIAGDVAVSFGVDSGGKRLMECTRHLDTAAKSCSPVSSAIGALANYVGAAVTPKGHRMAWYTNVKDGGGGSFSFMIDFGGGWNGPRTGPVGGFNDSSYVNIAFGVDGDADRFTMHSELVSGTAPAWSFVGGIGEGSAATDTPVVWSTSLVAPTSDSVISPNDILVDPKTADSHLLARTKKGAAAYYFRPKGGKYQGPLQVFDKATRARLVSLADGTLVLVRTDEQAGGVLLHVVAPSAIKAGEPVNWSAGTTIKPTLPADYKKIHAIYTESDSYSLAPRNSIELAIVGQVREHEVLHVSVTGLTR